MQASVTRDFLRLYRVRDWLHFLPLPLAGWITQPSRDVRALVGGVLAWGCALAYTSAINQAFDDRLDRLNAGKNPVGFRFARREAILLALMPAIATIVLVAWLAPSGLVPAIVMLVAATLYSAPPRLKRVPVLGTLWNVVIGLPGLFFAGWPDLSTQPLRLCMGLFALLLVVSQLIHEAEDREDDRAGGVSTVATLAGGQGALLSASVALGLLPFVAWWLSQGLSETARTVITIVAAAFAVLWMSILWWQRRQRAGSALRRVRLQYRYAALAFGAMAFLAAIPR